VVAIELASVFKDYPKKRGFGEWMRAPFRRQRSPALEGVSFQVAPGEAIALLGPNGAGKTTLLKILAGVVRPAGGEARVMGHDVLSEPRRARAAIGLVTADDRSFYQRLSARENLRFFSGLYGLARGAREGRIAELAAALAIGDVLQKAFNTLSSGQKARLAIARGLLHQPQVLLLDEVTRALDPGAAARLRDLVVTELVKGKGLALVLATHDLAEARAACPRVVLIDQGKVRADGAWDAVEPAIQATFFTGSTGS
jgi:ABC-2 type transport system ATP-binding protein